jgi:hypothetical protein
MSQPTNRALDREQQLSSIAALLADWTQKGRPERRHQKRLSFPSTQRIAAWNRRDYPPAAAFEEVQCHDLSVRGFSFLYSNPPSFESLIAILSGVGMGPLCMAAEVCHFREGFWNRERQFLVGCRFVGKVPA